jgi:hypothetical protein
MVKLITRKLKPGPNFEFRVSNFGVSAVSVLSVVSLLVPALFLWARSDSVHSSSEASLGTTQTLESKIRLLSGSEVEATKPFQPIVITESEANAYLKDHGREFLPPGVHDPALVITPERVFGAAVVDFDEFSRAYNNPNDWGPRVLAAMFKGKQRVTAAGKLDAQNGQGKVKIETVNIGTFKVPDWLVDFVLENYLQPRYKMDPTKSFVLPDHVTRIELGLGRATFFRSPVKQR